MRNTIELAGRRVFIATAAAILCYQLILPPVVGLADNGDFGKIISRFDLFAKVHRTYQFIDTVYEFHPERHWVSGFYSSEILLVPPALLLNSLLSKDGNFDIRLMGIVHGALFLAALLLFAPLLANARRAVRIGVCLLILLMYCDVMYVSGLNSFYMDEPAYLFLLLSVVLYLRVLRWHKNLDAILLLLCMLLVVTAKIQHALLGFFFAALLFATRGALWPARKNIIAAGAACIVLASLLMLWKGAPPNYASKSLYTVTFAQILPHSSDADRALKALGLDDSYRPFIGKNAYSPDSRMEDPAFHREFAQRMSAVKLAVFYALHPRDTYEALQDSLDEAGRQRLYGNFDIATGYDPFTASRAFAYWSNFKQRLFFHHGSRFLFTFLALSAVFSALLWVRRKELSAPALAGGFALIGMAFTELAVSSLLDAMDIVRHHLIFFALFDMMLIAVAYLCNRPPGLSLCGTGLPTCASPELTDFSGPSRIPRLPTSSPLLPPQIFRENIAGLFARIYVNPRITSLSRASVAIALAACLASMPLEAGGADTSFPVVIQLRVIEGDGAVYAVGSRATRGLAVQVTDETGKPVDAAAVSFQLPADGPGGSFAGGGKTEIVTTKADGIATVWGMQWNKTPGAFEIKVTASRGQARAGVAVTQYLSDTVKAGGEGTFTASHHSRTKWLIIAAAIGGGAAAGMGLRGSSSKSTAAAPVTTPLQIGNPTILVGHP